MGVAKKTPEKTVVWGGARGRNPARWDHALAT